MTRRKAAKVKPKKKRKPVGTGRAVKVSNSKPRWKFKDNVIAKKEYNYQRRVSQTPKGTSRDATIYKALPPGKRKVKDNSPRGYHYYYETRKNRSDLNGDL